MRALILLFYLAWQPVFANGSINFKKELSASPHWLPYLIALIAVGAILFYLAKLNKTKAPKVSKCSLVEQLTLNHKTKVYVVAFEQQQFMIADNLNGLAIHALNELPISHEDQ